MTLACPGLHSSDFSDLSLADFEARDATGMPASSAAGGGPGPSDGGGDGNSGAGGRPGEPSSGGGGGGGGGSGNSMGQSHKTSANGGSAANVRVTHQVSKRQAEGWEQQMGAGGAHGGMIADDALSLGASLGRGLCGTVSASRCAKGSWGLIHSPDQNPKTKHPRSGCRTLLTGQEGLVMAVIWVRRAASFSRSLDHLALQR